MTRTILLFLCIISFQGVKSQSLEFFREDLIFEIKEGYFYVDGIYHFCNVSAEALETTLFYPFPKDSSYDRTDSISIENTNTQDPISFMKDKENGIYFKLSISPYGIEKYRIKYRQKINGHQAEYILTSTQSWKKPFEIVNYQLIIPKNIKIESLSYEADSVSIKKWKDIYYWQKRDFMPDRNMLIMFSKKE